MSRLTCIGSAVPAPNWSAYEGDPSLVPAQCAGAATTSYVDAAPNVLLFSPHFAPARSWRSNLSWTSGLWGRTLYTIEGLYSLNLDQPSARDLNFSGVQRFTSADENRPVYANASSVVPANGVVSSV